MADVKYGNGIARVNVRFEGEQDPNRTHKKLLLVRQEANRSVRRNMSQKRATVHQRLALIFKDRELSVIRNPSLFRSGRT